MSFCTAPPASLESILYNRSTDHFRQFTAFVHSTFCTENLAFWLAVQHYHDLCHKLVGYCSGSAPPLSLLQEDDSCCFCCYSTRHDDGINAKKNMLFAMPPSLDATTATAESPFHCATTNSKSDSTSPPAFFDKIQEACHDILRNHIRPNSPQEINIPCDMRQQILHRVENDGNYHPAIFFPATDSVLELMRANSFIPWCTSMTASAPTSPALRSPLAPAPAQQHIKTVPTSQQESVFHRWWFKHQRRLGNGRRSSSSDDLYLVSARPYLSAPSTPRSSSESFRNWSPWRKIHLHRW